MTTTWKGLGFGICALTLVASATAAPAKSVAENGLLGIKLFDPGLRVIRTYGTPDEIQGVTVGGGQTSGGPGSSGFGGGFGGPPGLGGRGGAPGGAPSLDLRGPGGFGFANGLLQRPTMGGPVGAPGIPGAPPGASGGYPGSTPGSFPGRSPGGYPGGSGGYPGASGGGSSTPPVANTNSESVQYTRWVYNRAGSKYGFIVDKLGRVVQIEAIGIQNGKVKTKRGVGFGSTFATVYKAYGNPGGYDVAGDNLLVKYLTKNNVAFRMSRLGEKKPHVVTGIVVSAGKI